jgi:NAD(P)-dependent dehydrogenase (short-subunit alcohol dehydrogenase family)
VPQRLEGKVAVITGIGSGMGRAAAILFASEGASVVGCDIRDSSAESTISLIRDAGGKAVALESCDPSEPKQANALIDLAIET